ncbi:Gfo/Idh/MocA family protein [Leifsonia sp. NPDC058248]|uniref:Gfo/Idh/MocA family protein n=1 Tax=Leifsonia sp. NPDC058248 TaxID=3346402 RepID=UPI0036DD2CC9
MIPITSFPEPDRFEPEAVASLRWGIVGPGGIAESFASALRSDTRQRITAVASRERGRAEAFAAAHGIPAAHDLGELLSRDDVDVVYIATPPQAHVDATLRAIAAGKHVLVEKPFATTAADAARVLAAAREAGVFVTEAMWTRYLPQSSIMRKLVADGALGSIRLVLADHAQNVPSGSRLFDPRDGGALLDMGIYPFAFASEILGRPVASSTAGHLGPTGVDTYSVTTHTYEDGALAALSTGLEARSAMRASVAGTRGTLELHAPFFTPTALTVTGPEFSGESLTWRDDSGVAGLSHQATALAGYVADGLMESPLHRHQEIVDILGQLDAARHAIGARLDGEREGAL